MSCYNDCLDSDELEKELEMLIKNKPIINIKLSDEQLKIINCKNNILIDAVAGSGKTTTIIHLALNNPNLNIIQVTYNNMLKNEVRKKVNKLSIRNMEIHTYHSLVVKYYDRYGFTDEGLKRVLINNTKINNINDKIDILIIDEAQDMTIDYYNFLKKFILDKQSNPQIVILGDKYQGIYEFKGSDSKFLTLADKIWNRDFDKFNLSISFRLTNQIAWFVNNIMLKYDRIKTIKSGMIVDYYIGNPFNIYKKIGKQLINMINQNIIQPDDIFILSPSIKSDNSPYKKLENYLVKHNIKCMTPFSDDTKLDDKIISNKVVFTTFHQSKGRERKVVVLYNFDESFSLFSDVNLSTCPNILYVGVTRASYKLILIQDPKYKSLPFLNTKLLKNSQNLLIHNIDKQNLYNKQLKNKEMIKTSVTDLIKFLSSQSIDIIIKLIDSNNLFQEINNNVNNNIIDIPNKIKIFDNNNLEIWEDVSELNGIVIPSIYEKNILGKISTIEEFVLEQFEDKKIVNDIKKYIGKFKIPGISISDMLLIGNIYSSIQNKLHAKLAQIKKYDWLNEEMVLYCHKNMNFLTNDTLFEIPIYSNEIDNEIIYNHHELGEIRIRGRLDAIHNETVWEFKCTDLLTLEHKLQLIVYSWVWKKSILYEKYGKYKFKLLNIKTGLILELNYNDFIIDEIIQVILYDKYVKKNNINDEEFINQCNKNK